MVPTEVRALIEGGDGGDGGDGGERSSEEERERGEGESKRGNKSERGEREKIEEERTTHTLPTAGGHRVRPLIGRTTLAGLLLLDPLLTPRNHTQAEHSPFALEQPTTS